MPATQGGQRFDDLAQRWHDLADRRLTYFAELYRSGRWRHYYRTEQQFAARMLEVIGAAKTWAKIAGKAPPTITMPVPAASAPPSPPTVPPAAPQRDRLRSAA